MMANIRIEPEYFKALLSKKKAPFIGEFNKKTKQIPVKLNGLKITKDRLFFLYGERALLSIDLMGADFNKGDDITISLPKEWKIESKVKVL